MRKFNLFQFIYCFTFFSYVVTDFYNEENTEWWFMSSFRGCFIKQDLLGILNAEVKANFNVPINVNQPSFYSKSKYRKHL